MRRLVLALCLSLLSVGLAPVPAVAQATLPVPEPETNVDLPPGLIAYHEIAPRLNEIAASSDRVHLEVMGQSSQGRDLYLVTVAEPDTLRTLAAHKQIRDLMLSDPAAAKRRLAQFRQFKVPIWVNGSIHGNEWEGVDASIDMIERLATADDPETQAVLDTQILLFNVVQNPDGRVLGTRANGNGFDLNRDFITQSQPEATATARQVEAWNPMALFDLHGYVNPMLIEPCTPPHNPNYEYDLYIKWAVDQGEAMRDNLNEETGLEAEIPYLDYDGGWDDWPPIFTPQYAMYHGSYAYTLEAPNRVNGGNVELPPAEREAMAAENRAAHVAAVWGGLQFVAENKAELVDDQLEIFARQAANAPQMPYPGSEFGAGDAFTYPDAYVIPEGRRQASAQAAARLVRHLMANGVEVQHTRAAFRAGGRLYRPGTYLVDMSQPKRGIANTMLEDGWDISDNVPDMYDISGWSHALLWGATVHRLERADGWRAGLLRRPPVVPGAVVGSGSAYVLEVDDPTAVRGVNALLDAGAVVWRGDDGTAVVRSRFLPQVADVAAAHGLTFTGVTPAPTRNQRLADVDIAGAIGNDEFFVLTDLGFDVTRVSTTTLNEGAQLDEADILMVSSGLSYDSLDAEAQTEVTDYLASGGGLVTRGTTGANFNTAVAALPGVTFEAGPSQANGIVEVANDTTSPVTAGFRARDVSFVYNPVRFSLGEGADAQVVQRLGNGDFFVSGHWVGNAEAAGDPVVVSGTTTDGGTAVMFGTEPLFRAHPQKLFTQTANALFWAGS